MEVILLERVGKLGQMGDVVRVKDGYARNFLLPRGKALRATADNKSRFEGMKGELQGKSLEAKGVAGETAAKVDGKSYTVIRQASETGQLFGSVSTARHRRADEGRRRRDQPLAGGAQRADQVDRPVQGAAGAASGRRGLGHRHRRPQRRRKPSASRAARTSPCGARRPRRKRPRRWPMRKPSSSRKRPRRCVKAKKAPTPAAKPRQPTKPRLRPSPPRRPRRKTRRPERRPAHDPEKWEPVSRLREARFSGRRKVGKDHAQAKWVRHGLVGLAAPEHFPAKWEPVRRRKCDQIRI